MTLYLLTAFTARVGLHGNITLFSSIVSPMLSHISFSGFSLKALSLILELFSIYTIDLVLKHASGLEKSVPHFILHKTEPNPLQKQDLSTVVKAYTSVSRIKLQKFSFISKEIRFIASMSSNIQSAILYVRTYLLTPQKLLNVQTSNLAQLIPPQGESYKGIDDVIIKEFTFLTDKNRVVLKQKLAFKLSL